MSKTPDCALLRSGFFSKYDRGNDTGYARGQDLKAPAVLCWNGHVAILEKIDGNTAYISEGGAHDSDGAHGYCIIRSCSLNNAKICPGGKAFRGLVYLPGSSGGDGENKTQVGNVSFSSYSVGSITQTNAVPRCSISYSGARPSEAGLYFGTSQGNLRKVASDKINHNKNPFEVWYDLSAEAHLTLSASTKYYYQFYVIKDGKESKSDVNSLTTKGASVSFYNFSVSGLTKNNAVPRCSISYSGARPSSVGIYVGTSVQNMKKAASDKINHNKNPFDVWYNLRTEGKMTLKKNTKYYIKFYAIVNGAEYGSEIKYFVTKK